MTARQTRRAGAELRALQRTACSLASTAQHTIKRFPASAPASRLQRHRTATLHPAPAGHAPRPQDTTTPAPGPGRPARLSWARRCLAAAAAGAMLAAGLLALAAAAGVPHGESATSHARHGTAITLTSAADPSTAGGPVSYAATVRPAPGGGTVTFTDHAVPVPRCAAQPVSAAGTATCQAAYSSPGRQQVTAAYSGDTSYAASTSAPLTRQVTYRAQQLYVPAGPGPAGAVAAVTVELLDATGADVSGPGIPLTVTGLWPRPAPGVASVGPFASINVGLRPGYQLDVDTARYPAGTYTLTFTAGTDPLPHTAVFTLP